MRVIALDTHDNYVEGDEYEVADRVAEQLIRKGLVKAGKVPQNKMAAKSENKADPSEAAGEEQSSSASRAAPASAKPTAISSAAGGSVTPDPRFSEDEPNGVTQRARKKAATKKVAAKKSPGRPRKKPAE